MPTSKSGWREDKPDEQDFQLYHESLKSLLSQVAVVRMVDDALDSITTFLEGFESQKTNFFIQAFQGIGKKRVLQGKEADQPNNLLSELQEKVQRLKKNLSNIEFDVISRISLIEAEYREEDQRKKEHNLKDSNRFMNIAPPVPAEVLNAVLSGLLEKGGLLEEVLQVLKTPLITPISAENFGNLSTKVKESITENQDAIRKVLPKLAPIAAYTEKMTAKMAPEKIEKLVDEIIKEVGNLKEIHAEEIHIPNELNDSSFSDINSQSVIRVLKDVLSGVEEPSGELEDTNKLQVWLPVNMELVDQLKQAGKLDSKEQSSKDQDKHVYLKLPGAVDLTYWCPSIADSDQGYLNSCTASAAIALLQYFEKRTSSTAKYSKLSRLFLYKMTRKMDELDAREDLSEAVKTKETQSDDIDTGASIRQTLKAMTLFGVPPEGCWPYKKGEDNLKQELNGKPYFDQEPEPFWYAYAENYRLIQYFRLDPPTKEEVNLSKEKQLQRNTVLLVQIKAILAAGFPCIFGFPISAETLDQVRIFDSEIQKTGEIPFYTISQKQHNNSNQTGHALLAVGYDDSKEIQRGVTKI